ncbi:hypothetical protein BDEG_24478 [Batrachochytrium dendrobatidis JEL423]|uniref:Uncharacterized protein n=1 Tax=Batrachochytrium dendrobatidis (strain JEL423) TaxID=403673 RepID=A0A177WL02_BATDL|nr:hypothetical protein BDEG_24478 [Batrachochytrium dendrobatidis JEL423]
MEIETHFDGELDSKRPLDDVSTLIAAFQARPGSLLVETNYNAWDSLAALGTNGTVGSTPLIIKSKNDVGSNPTITGSYNYFKKTIQINGINVSTNHLKRPVQLDKLVYLV